MVSCYKLDTCFGFYLQNFNCGIDHADVGRLTDLAPDPRSLGRVGFVGAARREHQRQQYDVEQDRHRADAAEADAGLVAAPGQPDPDSADKEEST